MAKPHNTGRRAVAATDQRRRIMGLKLQGKSNADIGRTIGISRQRVHVIVSEELAKSVGETQKDTAAFRQLHIERLEALIATAWSYVVEAEDAGVAGSTAILDALADVRKQLGSKRGESSPDLARAIDRASDVIDRQARSAGAVAALNAIEKINRLLDRQAKLLGLDKPAAMELSGPDGGPLPFGFDDAAAKVYPDDPAGPASRDASEG